MTPAVQWELKVVEQIFLVLQKWVPTQPCTQFFFGNLDSWKWPGNKVNLEIGDADGCIKETESSSYYIWQIHQILKKVVAVCNDKTSSGCCTLRARAQTLGRSVLGQANSGIQACIAINKKDDDRREFLNNAQQALGEVMRGKEDAAAG